MFFAGDHDALLVLLMVPRIISKSDLLATQVRDKVSTGSSTSLTTYCWISKVIKTTFHSIQE